MQYLNNKIVFRKLSTKYLMNIKYSILVILFFFLGKKNSLKEMCLFSNDDSTIPKPNSITIDKKDKWFNLLRKGGKKQEREMVQVMTHEHKHSWQRTHAWEHYPESSSPK